MATLTIRDLDDSLKLKLRLRAAGQNRSMEEEARQILRAALVEPVQEEGAFLTRIRQRFAGLGDVRLELAPREPVRATLEIQEPAAAYRADSADVSTKTATRPRRPAKGAKP